MSNTLDPKYLVVSLPFDNSVTYDKCGNPWYTYGDPKIVNVSSLVDANGNKPFQTALDASNGLIYTVGNFIDNSYNFTISFWYYIGREVSISARSGYLFRIYHEGSGIRCYHKYGSVGEDETISIKFPTSSIDITQQNLFKFKFDKINLYGKWCKYYISYDVNNLQLQITINDSLLLKKNYYNTADITKAIPIKYIIDDNKYIDDTCIGGGYRINEDGFSFSPNVPLYFASGYIKNFEIYSDNPNIQIRNISTYNNPNNPENDPENNPENNNLNNNSGNNENNNIIYDNSHINYKIKYLKLDNLELSNKKILDIYNNKSFF